MGGSDAAHEWSREGSGWSDIVVIEGVGSREGFFDRGQAFASECFEVSRKSALARGRAWACVCACALSM